MNTLALLGVKLFAFTVAAGAMILSNGALANNSGLTLSAELPTAELSRWMSEALPEAFSDEGEQSVCKRVIGVKMCGDARWQYQVQRTGPITLPKTDNSASGLRVAVPLRVQGNVGVQGDMSRLLGLNSVPISAALTLFLDAGIRGNAQGCPELTVNLLPQWKQKPTAVLPGNIKISFTEVLENTLMDQVQEIQRKINESYDCAALLAQLQPLWSLCYLDASQERTGPGVWKIELQNIHWSVQTARANHTYALVAGINSNLALEMGLTQADVLSRLQSSDCETIWEQVAASFSVEAPVGYSVSVADRLVFDPQMASNSKQAIRLNIAHRALAAYAESELSHKDLGKDDRGNTLVLKTVQLEPVDLEDATALALQTQFSATVRAGKGVSGWFQRLLGFNDKTLEGVMRVQAKPVWNKQTRVLSFDAVDARVTQLEPSVKLSLTNAAFALLERQAKKSLAEQSSLDLGSAIDRLSKKMNTSLDPKMTERLLPYGGQWRANTASVQINELLTLANGMALDAQLNADWVIRFSSENWPTDFSHWIQ